MYKITGTVSYRMSASKDAEPIYTSWYELPEFFVEEASQAYALHVAEDILRTYTRAPYVQTDKDNMRLKLTATLVESEVKPKFKIGDKVHHFAYDRNLGTFITCYGVIKATPNDPSVSTAYAFLLDGEREEHTIIMDESALHHNTNPHA